MHPEIKKFWESKGYKIVVDILEGTYPDDLWRFYWVLVKDGRQVEFAGVSNDQPQGTKDAPCTTYLLNHKEFSEKEMLRIIKQKAFL